MACRVPMYNEYKMTPNEIKCAMFTISDLNGWSNLLKISEKERQWNGFQEKKKEETFS